MDDVRRVSGAEILTCPQKISSVTVWLGGGDLAVLPCGADEPARVEVHEVSGPPLSVSWVEGALRVEHREPGEQLWAALRRAVSALALPATRLALVVPAGAAVTVRTATAAVYVEGLTAALAITTVSGAVTLRDVSGVTDVTTGAGAVQATHLAGQLKVKTATGGVAVQGAELRAAGLATVSGRLSLDLAVSNCLVTSTTAGGSLDVRAPRGAGYDLTASAPRGAVSIDGAVVLPDGDDPRERPGPGPGPGPGAGAGDVAAPEVPGAEPDLSGETDNAPGAERDADGAEPDLSGPAHDVPGEGPAEPGGDEGTGAAQGRRGTVHRGEGDRALVIKARTRSGSVSLRRELPGSP